jgi:nucleolar protein 56
MQHYWFGDLEGERCTPAPGDIRSLAERVESLSTSMEAYVPLRWETARDCGCVADRGEYIGKLRDICTYLAEQRIAEYYQQSDIELLQMVRVLDEMDTVVNMLTEKATEWYIVRHPEFSRKYRSVDARRMVARMKRERSSPLGHIAAEIERISNTRASLMKEVSARADMVIPNCSALVGGLVAARLLSRAGGLEQMTRLPASTIQVLGAENALFTHLRSGSPSPKHGIIFQHRRVHNAQKEVRGRVARVVAAKLCIAAKIDYFRGELDAGFLEQANKRIDEAGGTA